MLALQHLCLRKRTSGSKDVEGKGDGNGEGEGERYILNATGGRQNSGEENRVCVLLFLLQLDFLGGGVVLVVCGRCWGLGFLGRERREGGKV